MQTKEEGGIEKPLEGQATFPAGIGSDKELDATLCYFNNTDLAAHLVQS